MLHNCLCDYRGEYPEYDSNNADKQKQCKDYKKWIDPIKQKQFSPDILEGLKNGKNKNEVFKMWQSL